MKPLTVLASALILFAACKKDKNEPPVQTPAPTQKANKEYLVAGKWQVQKVVHKFVQNGDTTTNDMTANLGECSKDDILIFESSGRELRQFGTNKCPGQSGDVDTNRTWKMPNENQLYENQGGPGAPDIIFDIVEINDSIFTTAIGDYTSNRTIQTYKNVK